MKTQFEWIVVLTYKNTVSLAFYWLCFSALEIMVCCTVKEEVKTTYRLDLRTLFCVEMIIVKNGTIFWLLM